MPILQKHVTIHAAADQIFAVLSDPRRLPEYASGISAVRDVQQTSAHIGDACTAVYGVVGLTLALGVQTLAWEAPTSLRARLTGPLQGVWHWTLEAQDASTIVRVELDYQLRLGTVGAALNAVLIERVNEKNLEHTLRDLKALLEDQ